MGIFSKKPPKSKNSIYLCFKWIYIILYYMGCLCFQSHGRVFQLTKINIFYTHYIRLILLVCFLGSSAMKCSDSEGSRAMLERLSPLRKFVLASECFNSALTYIVVSVSMEKNKHKHIKLIQNFQDLDQRMRCDFPNINWNYHKTVRKYSSFMFVVIAYYYLIAILYIFKLSNCNCEYVLTLVLTLSYATITAAPGYVTFLHLGMMDLQRIRYRLIQRLLQQHYSSKASRKSDAKHELRLQRIIHYCKNYIQMILHVNDVFGLACGIGLFHDFTVLAKLTFLMCQKAIESYSHTDEYIYIFLFMIPRLYKVAIYAIYGYATQREQRNCTAKVRLCEKMCNRSKAVRLNLEFFLHWKMQNSYEHLIGKVNPCNLVLLYSTVNSIVSSVVILIQLQLQQNNITKRMRNME